MRIEASNNCNFFSYVLETAIPANNTITFPTAVQASNVKIIITAADPASADTKPMAINRYFFHLLPKPRTYFYVQLIDGAARIFPTSNAATGNQTHVSSVAHL